MGGLLGFRRHVSFYVAFGHIFCTSILFRKRFIMVRKRYLSEEEYTRMVYESFSDSDESDDSFSLELENDFSDETCDSNTDILSLNDITKCKPSGYILNFVNSSYI